jgi:hypothetical protein
MNPLVEAVRKYIDTPFRHQGRLPGVALDCAGVVVCGLRECGCDVSDVKGYGRIPSNGLFIKVIEEQCDPIPFKDIVVGDFLVFSFISDPQHIAIVSSLDPLLIIHAYSDVKKVVENSVDDFWRARLKGCYRKKDAPWL